MDGIAQNVFHPLAPALGEPLKSDEQVISEQTNFALVLGIQNV